MVDAMRVTLSRNVTFVLVFTVVVLCVVIISQVQRNDVGWSHALVTGNDDVTALDYMDSKLVIATLRSQYLIQPPPPNTPLNLDNPAVKDPSEGQAKIIRGLLNDQKDGFFIECGAFDGESLSNTLVLERELNWTGLLIEADPKNVAMLVKKGRHAFLSPTCLSTTPYSMTVSFHQFGNGGKISDETPGFKQPDYNDVQCFPLYSYLLALGRTTIDYFSLDVEGHEFEVLEHIPFDKVNIRTLSVEWNHVARGKEALRQFMEDKGYSTWGEIHTTYAADIIFHKL